LGIAGGEDVEISDNSGQKKGMTQFQKKLKTPKVFISKTKYKKSLLPDTQSQRLVNLC
jgi:hypothetical protein